MLKFSKNQFFDFVILVLRWYLAIYMILYGWGKLTGNQFGVFDQTLLDRPLKNIDKFYLAWYLFSLNKSFDVVVGLIQIISGLLILINRTVLLGSLLLLPILGQIFLIDLAFTTSSLGLGLPLRLAGMIVSDLLVLLYYKDRMILVWQNLTAGVTTKFNYKWWFFLIIPFLGLAMDFVINVLAYPVKYFIIWMTK